MDNQKSNDQPRKRYSDSELKEFKELIEKKLERSREELAHLQDQMLEINEEADAIKAGNFDEGSQNYEREHIAKMLQRVQDFIKNLEFALIRIQNKTYGVCSITGELIDKKRLMLVPHTTKSIEGKTIEKRQQEEQPKQDSSRLSIKSENGKPKITSVVSRKGANGNSQNWDDEDSLGEFDMEVPIEDIDLSDEIIEAGE